MENQPRGRIFRDTQIIILGVCIALATLGAAVILSQGFIKIKKFATELITVTGSAEKKITSDFSVWRAQFSRRAPQLKEAYDQLVGDTQTVKNYLLGKGAAENEMIVSQITTEVLYKKNEDGNDTNEIEAYKLSREIEVQSRDVYKLARLCREATELIHQGVEFISPWPEYFYTRLAELKHEMLAQATEDAKKRAEQMAKATGNQISLMRSAKMGVFQITPANSTVVSDYGMNDTSSLEKKVTAVVKVDFAIAE